PQEKDIPYSFCPYSSLYLLSLNGSLSLLSPFYPADTAVARGGNQNKSLPGPTGWVSLSERWFHSQPHGFAHASLLESVRDPMLNAEPIGSPGIPPCPLRFIHGPGSFPGPLCAVSSSETCSIPFKHP